MNPYKYRQCNDERYGRNEKIWNELGNETTISLGRPISNVFGGYFISQRPIIYNNIFDFLSNFAALTNKIFTFWNLNV